ncbi:B12-binding domain-containing radical SAM protein [bacterium]|nr:B12-binding domain-containing radical SAM protein [bacterium]
MKIALIFPNLHAMPQTLDLGIVYLATYIKERTEHEVLVIDVTFHSRDWQNYVKQKIEGFQPDVICFSTFSVLWDCAKLITRDIFTYYKKVPVVVGGYQAIMCAQETIEAEEVDIICTGEGELTMAAYLDALKNNLDLSTVHGIWYKDRSGVIMKNPNRGVAHLDDLPFPDWDVFEDIEKYLYFLGRLYAIGTRGCPYKCSFCAETALEVTYKNKRWRERDPIRYVDEIEYQYNKYKNRGMYGLHLFDTVFSFSEEWLIAWTEEYKRRGLHKKLPFTVFARPDQHNMSEKKIQILADAGCAQVRMGIESGDTDIRKTELRKPGCSNNIILDRIQLLNKYGILAKTYSIIGFPHDNKQSIWKTFSFANNPFVQTKFVLSYSPIPGTPMAAKVEKMHREKNIQKFSFHFSGGVKNSNYGPHYINIMLLWCYIYFGMELAWRSLKSDPINFFKIVPSRIFMGWRWGNPLLLTTLYSLIHATYWPGWRKEQKKYWQKAIKKLKQENIPMAEGLDVRYLPEESPLRNKEA